MITGIRHDSAIYLCYGFNDLEQTMGESRLLHVPRSSFPVKLRSLR